MSITACIIGANCKNITLYNRSELYEYNTV